MNVRTAQAAYDRISWKADVGASQEAADLWEATTNYEQAEAEYQEALEGASEDDLAASRAQVALAQAELNALQEDPDPDELAAAQAQVTQAQAELELLLAGASSEEKEKAELSVAQAQLELDSAQRALDETMLVAPISGIVTSIEAEVGEAVGSDAIITLADLAEPVVQFWIEEADLRVWRQVTGWRLCSKRCPIIPIPVGSSCGPCTGRRGRYTGRPGLRQRGPEHAPLQPTLGHERRDRGHRWRNPRCGAFAGPGAA